MGMMLRPMIDAMDAQMSQHATMFSPTGAPAGASASGGGGNSAATSFSSAKPNPTPQYPAITDRAPTVFSSHPPVEKIVGKLNETLPLLNEASCASLAKAIEHYLEHPMSADSARGELGVVYPFFFFFFRFFET
jgi:hypothetical protein